MPLLLAWVLAGLQETPAEDPAPPAAALPGAATARVARGTAHVRFRHRWTSDASDSDVYEILTFAWGDEDVDAVTAAASVRFAHDLDGERSVEGGFVFGSLDDSYRHGSTARLYTAYADVRRLAPGLRLRGGRQVLEEFPEAVIMDGGLLRQDLGSEAAASVFGGVPANLFESSSDGDALYGGSLEVRPWRLGRLRADFLHIDDATVFGEFDDDLAGVSLEQGIGPVFATLRHTFLERQSRDTVLHASAAFAEQGLVLDLRLAYLHERIQALSYPLDPFATFLLELQPYVDSSIRASKTIGGPLAVDASFTVRELADDGDESAYNHEFRRVSLAPRMDGFPWPELSVVVTADFWSSSADDFWTLGGDAALALSATLTVSAGSSYALFTADAFTGEERERVRLYYASMRWRPAKGVDVQLRVERERNDLDTFHAVTAGVGHAF